MEKIFQLMQKDHFAAANGIKLIEVGEGTAKAVMVINENHLNGFNTVQGGALFTLADLAFAAACNSRNKMAVSLNANINYIKPVSSGTLTATAREVDLKRSISIYSVDIHNETGELIATFQSTAYRKEACL